MLRIIIGMVFIIFDIFLYAGGNVMGIMLEYSDMVFLDMDVVQVEHILGVLPDFVGFLLLFFGMKAEQDKCRKFTHNKKYMIPFAIFGYGICLANLYGGISKLNYYLVLLCGVLSVLSGLYATYLVGEGMKFVEDSYSVSLGAKRILYIWKVFALCCFLEHGARIIGLYEVYILCYIAKVIAGVVLIVYTTQTAIIYSEYKRNNRL